MDIKYIGGASPEMVLLDKEYNEVQVGELEEPNDDPHSMTRLSYCVVQRVPVDKMSSDAIIELLNSHGIVKRSAEEAEKDENFESFERQDL